MSGTTPQRERRQFVRVPVQHFLSFAPSVSGAPVEPINRLGKTLDIAAGGLRLETDHPLDVGDRLILEIAVDSQMVHAEATVVHLPPSSSDLTVAGVAFDYVPADDRETLSALGYAA